MELLCNQDFVEDIKKLKGHLRIHSNSIEISINKKSNIPGYNKKVVVHQKGYNGQHSTEKLN